VNLSSQFILTTISKTTQPISIFVLSVVLSRYFTKDEYGTYLHIQLIVNLAVWTFLLGLPHSIYYFLPKVKNQKKFINTTCLMLSAIAVVVACSVYLNSDLLSKLLVNPNIEKLSYILLFLILFQIPLSLFEPLMITAKRVKEFALIELFFNVSFLMTVLSAVVYELTVENILVCLAVLYMVHNVIVLAYTIHTAALYKKPNKTGDPYTLSEQFSYSMPIGLSMAAVEASRYADKIIVSNQTTPEDYAVYTRGAMEIPIISILANTLDNLLMPRFVESYKNNDTEGIIKSWHSVIRMMAAFIYPCCLFLICTAEQLIPALFTDKYIGSVIIFQVYTLGLLTRISTFNVIVRAIGKTKVILWISIGTIIFNITLTYIFMSWWGVVGAPIATVLTATMMRAAYLISITHYLNIELARVFPWNALLQSLLSAVLASVPILFLLPLEINVWAHLLLMGCVYSACYLLMLRISSALKIEEKETVRKILPKQLKWLV
jgi:O-antigen/teichoic acid export membrane protein